MQKLTNYTVIDFETTGLTPKTDKVIEIGAVKVADGRVIDTYGTLVQTTHFIPVRIIELTGISPKMVASGMPEDEAMGKLVEFIGEDVIVGHNISFDYSFLKQWAANQKLALEMKASDTLRLARALLPGAQPKKLDALCEFFEIPRENAHRALDDAIETQILYEKLATLAAEQKPELLEPRQMMCKVKRQTPATRHQIERLQEFRRLHGIEEMIDWESLTRSEASRIQDRYYAAYGRCSSSSNKDLDS